MHRQLASLLPAFLVLLLSLALPAQTQESPTPNPDASQNQEGGKESRTSDELDDEKKAFEDALAKANKDLKDLDEKEDEKKKLLELVKQHCQEGLALIERFRALSLENIAKPYDSKLLILPAKSDYSIPSELEMAFYLMSSEQREKAKVEYSRKRRLIENQLQELQGLQRSLVNEGAIKERELALAQSRNESRIRKDKEEADLKLAAAVKALDGSPKPADESLRSLTTSKLLQEVKLKVLDRERRRRKDWIEWLKAANLSIQEAVQTLQDGQYKAYMADVAGVDDQLNELKVYLLPIVALPETPGMSAEKRSRIVDILHQQRVRIEELINRTAKAQTLRRRLETEKVQVSAEVARTVAVRDNQLQRTAKADESPSIRSFRLQMGIKALERELDRPVLEGFTWREISAENRRQANQLDALQLETEDIRDRVHGSLVSATDGQVSDLTQSPREYIEEWTNREEKESRSLLDVTEGNLVDLLGLQGLLGERREGVQVAIHTLEGRGLFLRDPQRLIMRGQGFSGLFVEMGKVFRGLWSLPVLIYDAAVHRDPQADAIGWSLYLALVLVLCLGALSFWLRGRARIKQREILDQEEPERAQIFRLSVLGWIYRMLPWTSLGLIFFVAATLFSPGSQEGRLCNATGKFFLYASFWIVTSRVLLRPAKPKLRFFLIGDGNARRLYRIVSFGLVFWLLGLIGEMMGALLSGYQGRIFEAALQTLRDGGLLLMAYLFFNKRAFLVDLFPSPADGGLNFLQAFVLTALWPIRIALVISLGAWLITYYDLANALGLWIIGGFGSLLIAVTFHQIMRHEINDRFFLHRYRVDEDTLRNLSDEEQEALVTDRNKVAKLMASFIEIAEFLASVALFLGAMAWFYDVGWAGIQGLLGVGLWGNDLTGSLVTLGNLLAFVLTIFLTISLTKRSGPTINYVLEKRTDIDRGMRYTMGTLGGYLVFIAGIGIAFSQLHIGFAQVSWILAAMGVGIGFGLQDIVSNFFSGLILLFERPLRVGDIVNVGETLGEVKKITIRSTTVTSFDNIDVIVPNKDFISSSITNWTASDRDMRSTIDVGVAYGSDLKQVRQVLADTVCKHGRVFKKPAPSIFIKGFGDSSIDFAVVYWTLLDFKRGTFSDLHFAIEAAFGREGIEIPFPQRDVHFKVDDEIPVVIRGVEPGALDAVPEGEEEVEEDDTTKSKTKRDDDREIRRMSYKTEASDEIEAGGDGGGGAGGDADL